MQDLLRELENIHARNMKANDYEKTLALLRALKSGSVTLGNVSLTADGWQLVDSGKPAVEQPPEVPSSGEPT